MTTTTFLKLGSLRGPLNLERAPRFLRFVMQGSKWDTLDALDQPDDAPRDGEKCYAAEQVDSTNVHFSGYRNGKRFGEWRKTATYKLVEDQPAQEVMRDWEQWKVWCEEQMARSQAH